MLPIWPDFDAIVYWLDLRISCEVDDESDADDSDLDEDELIEAMAVGLISDDYVIASRLDSREGSPMDWS